MSSALWDADEGLFDNGGVHTNSGVGNKAAYLIAHGATFYGTTVKGIGVTKTWKIYWATENMLPSGADYQDLGVSSFGGVPEPHRQVGDGSHERRLHASGEGREGHADEPGSASRQPGLGRLLPDDRPEPHHAAPRGLREGHRVGGRSRRLDEQGDEEQPDLVPVADAPDEGEHVRRRCGG